METGIVLVKDVWFKACLINNGLLYVIDIVIMSLSFSHIFLQIFNSGAIQAVQSSNYFPANQMQQTGCYQAQQPAAGLQVSLICLLTLTNFVGQVLVTDVIDLICHFLLLWLHFVMPFWHQSKPFINNFIPEGEARQVMDSDFLSCDFAAVIINLRLEVIYETPFWTEVQEICEKAFL